MKSAVTTEDANQTRVLNPHVKLVVAEDMGVFTTAEGTRKLTGFQGEDLLTARLVEAHRGPARARWPCSLTRAASTPRTATSPRKSLEDTLRFPKHRPRRTPSLRPGRHPRRRRGHRARGSQIRFHRRRTRGVGTLLEQAARGDPGADRWRRGPAETAGLPPRQWHHPAQGPGDRPREKRTSSPPPAGSSPRAWNSPAISPAKPPSSAAPVPRWRSAKAPTTCSTAGSIRWA